MWWFFEKLYEDDNIARYAYARERYEPDGEMLYHKSAGEVEIVKPSATTPGDSEQDFALRHWFAVVEQGYPEKTQVAIG